MTITGRQINVARLLLGWSREKLAAEANLSTRTIMNFEGHIGRPLVRTVRKIQRAFEAAGGEFVDSEPGVKLRKAEP
jgi:transcriptional regulator with XRE-family HTH domain